MKTFTNATKTGIKRSPSSAEEFNLVHSKISPVRDLIACDWMHHKRSSFFPHRHHRRRIRGALGGRRCYFVVVTEIAH